MIHLAHTDRLRLFFIFISLFIASVFLVPISTYAQNGLEGMVVAHIELSPKYPTPGEMVKATLKAPTIDKDTALITWTLNGTVIQKAYSDDSVTFTVGNVGDISKLSVSAVDGKKTQVTAQSNIIVSDVVIIWEGRTYTPPLYKGRALQSPGSSVAITVIPRIVDGKGRMYDANELSYLWSINYSSAIEQSGKGKHSVLLQNDQPMENFMVNLQIKDPQGEVRTTKKILIPVSEPVVVLYEDSSLAGIWYDKALSTTLSIYDREATVVAEPYYVSTPTRTSPILEYVWSVDKTEYTNSGNLTFAPTQGSAAGTSYLTLVIKNTKYWLQNGRSSLTIDFGQRSVWGDTSFETSAL